MEKWLNKAEVGTMLDMDGEDLDLIPWRTFKRRLCTNPHEWQYDPLSIAEYMKQRTEAMLKDGRLAGMTDD